MPLVYQGEGSSVVVASPATNAETIIVQLPALTYDVTARGVLLNFGVNFTVGTSGTAAVLRIRRTGLTGTLVTASPALTVVAANLVSLSLDTTDTPGDVSGLVYVGTLQITGGAATSTVGTVCLSAQAMQ